MSTNFDFRTLYGTEAKRERKGGWTNELQIRRQTLEDFFGEASFDINDSLDGKVNFEWVLKVEESVVIRIYSYKNKAAVDPFCTTWWSVSTNKLGAKLLAEELGVELTK